MARRADAVRRPARGAGRGGCDARRPFAHERYRADEGPIERGCDCPACMGFSRAYIRHLFGVEEMLGPILVSLHNLRFYHRLMERIRDLIPSGGLESIYGEYPVAGGGWASGGPG